MAKQNEEMISVCGGKKPKEIIKPLTGKKPGAKKQELKKKSGK